MAKSGPQLHDYYFEKYELLTIQYPFNKKSESEKKHTLNFKNYNFRDIILDFIKEYDIIEKFPEYKLTQDEIVEIIMYLFYPHAVLAKNSLQIRKLFTPDDYVQNLLDGIHEAEISVSTTPKDFSDFFELKLMNDALENSYLDNNESENKSEKKFINIIKRKLNNKNNDISTLYNKMHDTYKFFLFQQIFNNKNNDMIFFLPEYSGLITYFMLVKNKYKKFLLETTIYNPYTPRKSKNENSISNYLLPWYDELFNQNNSHYMELDGENKILEQQILDMYFGISSIGYALKQFDKYKLAINRIQNMPLEIAYEPLNISEFAYIGVLGLSAPIKRIISQAIFADLDGEKDHSEIHSRITSFYDEITNIFCSFLREFFRYIAFLKTYDSRIAYVADLEPPVPQVTDDWHYLIYDSSKNFNVNIATNDYIDLLNTLDFHKLFTLKKCPRDLSIKIIKQNLENSSKEELETLAFFLYNICLEHNWPLEKDNEIDEFYDN